MPASPRTLVHDDGTAPRRRRRRAVTTPSEVEVVPDGADQPFAVWITRRLRRPIVAIGALVVLSTAGYMLLERYGIVDALYMTVITLGTIGYGEVRPLGTGGRIFTIGVIVLGFVTLIYTAAVLTNVFTSGDATRQIRDRRTKLMRDELHDHVVVVGFGRVGQAVVRSLIAAGRHCVVIDKNADHGPAIEAFGALHVHGDGTNEADLARAGINRATALISAADSDATNLVVVLTARAARQDLRIVSRVDESGWLTRMSNAGADVAQSPYESYGATLAASAVTKAVLDLHDLPLLGLGTEEIAVAPDSPLVGKRLDDLVREHLGVHVLGLRREERLRKWHDIEGEVHAGDILVVLGTPEDLAHLAQASQASEPA